MKYYFRKIKTVVKATILCLALSIILLFAVMSPGFRDEKQTFDMKSSVVISLGFGTAICLCINNREKE